MNARITRPMKYSVKQWSLIVLAGLATGLLLFYLIPGKSPTSRNNGDKIVSTSTPLTIEEFLSRNDDFEITEREGVLFAINGGDKVMLVDMNKLEGPEWRISREIDLGAVKAPHEPQIAFAISDVFFIDDDISGGLFARSKLYVFDLENDPEPILVRESDPKSPYFWEPIQWNENSEIFIATITTELAGTGDILVISPDGDLIRTIPPGPSFEGR